MKHLDVIAIAMIIFISANLLSDTIDLDYRLKSNNYQEFKLNFQTAVADMGAYLAQLEAQQTQAGVRYSKEQQLALDVDSLNVFIANLAMKFGVEGNSVAVQNLLLHIPVMAFMKYDGYELITIGQGTENEDLVPVFWPKKPYTYVTDKGYVLLLTLDNNLTLYDPNTNQYIEGTYDQIRYVRDLSPIVDQKSFEEIKRRAIIDALEIDMQNSMNTHLRLVNNLGLAIELYIPDGLEDLTFSGIGFLAFIQGYPLPGGQTLNSVAFGGGSVRERETYIGIIRSDGRHLAYPERCSLPPGVYTIIEVLQNDLEAARKGYFVQDCN